MQQLLNPVVELCREAGQAILDVYHGGADMGLQTKADDSPVTRADLNAHNILEPGLEKLLPGIPVLSEEGGIPDFSVRQHWSRYWLVDPLDGTREFINRNGEFTVNVALIDNGCPILGVVYVPVSGVAYTGIAGGGANKIVADTIPINTSKLTDQTGNARSFTVVSSRRYGTEAVDRLLAKLPPSLGAVATRHIGSSLKMCLIAEGAADFYPRLAPTSEWDTAAAQAVVEAAGGALLDHNLRPLRYNRKESLLNPNFFVVGDRQFDWGFLVEGNN
ncbi:MAG: 3'(2'),5'-bisphosphate nucleotidase CysQ [Candidatus Pelagadaptatus aseana]|uniref:3'(2'),5'-bisphosphate nucleotidase CysQ n=1 Tax=Candidatus Pelagadaptatus aseana TaxID=3120508 RepID=UPI0039B2D451